MLNNDWIVANINNPDYSTEMFKMKGIDTDNTQMLKEESYLKSNFIINNPAFADNNGNFNKDKWWAIIQAVVNLIVSILAASRFGLVGVYMGTIAYRKINLYTLFMICLM